VIGTEGGREGTYGMTVGEILGSKIESSPGAVETPIADFQAV
jgi:hypothetical protein